VDAGWLITILDDRARFVTASQIFKEGTTENVIWLLNKAIHEYTKPREILTDHVSQFWSVRRGESNFDTNCQRRKVRNILGGVGKPSTLGKTERCYRTCDQESAGLPVPRKFIQYHSYERPHMALDYPTAAEVHFHNVPNAIG
jgi:putative transposase